VNGRARAKTARVFFAFWPNDAVRNALARCTEALQIECGGRAMAASNIHATLAFIGNVAAERLPELEKIASAVEGTAFDLSLDVLSYWRHHRIVWAGTRTCPDALTRLAADFHGALRAGNWRLEERPFVLHLTMLRDAGKAPADTTVGPIAWRVGEFALVRSRSDSTGTHYTPLRFWPLRGEYGARRS
jgi:2'-5' RNA ligase